MIAALALAAALGVTTLDGRPIDPFDVWAGRPDVSGSPSGRLDMWDSSSGRPDMWDSPSGRLDMWDSPSGRLDMWDSPSGRLDMWGSPSGRLDLWGSPSGRLDMWGSLSGRLDMWRSPSGRLDMWGSPSGLPDKGHPVRALVFVFVQPDCPVSNRYVPELNRLFAEYDAQGIRMYVVYSGAEDRRDAIRAHHAEYGLRVPALVDPGLALADAAGVAVTPEAAVFRRGPNGAMVVYRGRIDDRAGGPGVWRPAAATRDLGDVLARIARGAHVAPSSTRAYGCYLRSLSH